MNNFSFEDMKMPEIQMPKIRIPDIPTPPTAYMWSDTQYEIIKKYIEDFEEQLDENSEVAVKLANFGQTVLMVVDTITFEKSVVLIFSGEVNGRKSTLIQHINQLSFLLTSVPRKTDTPRRKIGFARCNEDNIEIGTI